MTPFGSGVKFSRICLFLVPPLILPVASFITISAYRFTPLSDLKPLRERLLAACKTGRLKGTILLSTEGINLFVSGLGDEVEKLLALLRSLPGLETLAPKYSESAAQPFNRMLVRIKKEIIAFGVEGIDPSRHTSPKLSAQTLKQWLDEGRPLTLLDTRNDYEVKLGTFTGARDLGIGHFRDFPGAVAQLEPELKERPVVMFCTGGIRCEKAGPFLEKVGFREVFQLDGGILKYFEEVGGDHYEGECFVFDQRTGLDPSLQETGSTQCFACQTPLTKADQQHPRYVVGKCCPYCYRTEEEDMALRLRGRHEGLRRFTSPLPGSVAYDNHRPLSIPASLDQASLLDVLCEVFPHFDRDHWKERCAAGLFLNPQGEVVFADHQVRAGEIYRHSQPATIEPEVSTDVVIRYEDEAFVIVDKPAPLPVHPSGRYNRNTLQHWMRELYHPENPRPVHRLDSNTTGLTLWARTRHFAGRLQEQFKNGTVDKRYLARVIGHPEANEFACDAPIRSTPGPLGSRGVDEEDGRASLTKFRVLSRDPDGNSLLEAQPITGRTNQIRVHLWELGYPIVGDPVYLAGKTLGDTQTLGTEDEPLCLHAWRLGFEHPLSGKRVSFQARSPSWLEASSIAPLPR